MRVGGIVEGRPTNDPLMTSQVGDLTFWWEGSTLKMWLGAGGY